MIHVDLSLLRLDPQIKKGLEDATEQLKKLATLDEKDKFIGKKSSSDKWHAVLGPFAQLTHNTEIDCKCWYCESDGAAGFYFHIDHFRPKGRVKNKGYKRDEYEPGYWWLAFNPDNYRIACQRCNTGAGKKDQFPLADGSVRAIFFEGEKLEKALLLDPINPKDPDLLIFSQDGNVSPIPNCFESEKKRVETSIEVYDLRNENKCEARRKIWIECINLITEARQYRERLKESIIMADQERDQKENDFKVAYSKIKKMITPNARFSATAKSCVKQYYKIEKTRSIVEDKPLDIEWLFDIL